jgi:hypothetical protein
MSRSYVKEAIWCIPFIFCQISCSSIFSIYCNLYILLSVLTALAWFKSASSSSFLFKFVAISLSKLQFSMLRVASSTLILRDSYKHIPRMLYCGHTICEICLCNILDSNIKIGKEFFCPSCITPHTNIKTKEDIKNLIKNISLMRICEKIELKKTILSNSIASIKNLDISLQNSLKFNNFNNDNRNLQQFNNPFLNNKV